VPSHLLPPFTLNSGCTSPVTVSLSPVADKTAQPKPLRPNPLAGSLPLHFLTPVHGDRRLLVTNCPSPPPKSQPHSRSQIPTHPQVRFPLFPTSSYLPHLSAGPNPSVRVLQEQEVCSSGEGLRRGRRNVRGCPAARDLVDQVKSEANSS
jgi:hypothetical protein